MDTNYFEFSYAESVLKMNLDGGTVLGWKNKNEEVFYQGSNDKRSGIPILFPFANPLENDIFQLTGLEIPQHGFARKSLWSLRNISDSVLELSLNYKNIDPTWQKAYPFKFDLNIILDISTPNVLSYCMQVQNLDHKNIPIAPGIHPYFPISHINKMNLQIQTINLQKIDWETNSDGYFFDFDGEIQAQFPNGKTIKIQEISPEKEFQNIVIWSQNEEKEDFDFVCLEPFTRKSNAINTAPILVRPQEAWEKTIIFEILS